MIRGNGKFLVLKNEDLDRYLDEHSEDQLYNIFQTMEAGRIYDGKVDDNQYLVINRDEPYAEEVIEIMKKHGHWEGE
jgi:hypothetical protein